jgi:hypothetical protein
MKFPSSIHAEGWYDHFEAAPGGQPSRRSNRVRPDTPLRDASAPAANSPVAADTRGASASGRRPSAGLMLGLSVGAAVLAGGAAALLRSGGDTPPETVAAAASGQVAPQPATPQPAAPTELNAQAALDSAPPAAGPLAAAPAEVKPEPRPEPKLEARPAAPKLAAAPEPKVSGKNQTQTPTEAVVGRLMPMPQVSAEPMPLETSRPVAVAPTPAIPAPVADASAASAARAVTAPAPVAMAAADDAGISANVKAALATDPALGPALVVARILVSTDHGIVKLEGQAPDAASRERATVLASATNGVRGVDNRLALPVVVGLLKQEQATGIASGQ